MENNVKDILTIMNYFLYKLLNNLWKIKMKFQEFSCKIFC